MNIQSPETPHLRWVLVGGNLCEVSEFSDLPRKARPAAHCPVCERQVTLKLGQKLVHHFAHQPEDVCAATNPETAIHLNCKFHIYRQLQGAKKVSTSVPCSRCGKRKPVFWKSNWDTVEVEYRMDSLRPDIALLKQGKVIGAIEVYVTHAVGDEKSQRLQSQGIDWIEVRGQESIYEEPTAWTVAEPLAAIKQYPTLPVWTCWQCQKAQEREEYERTNHSEPFFARMMDLYFRSGKKYRQVFYVKHTFADGEEIRMWIEDGDGKIIADERTPITKQSKERLNKAFKQKLRELTQKASVVDDEMKWIHWRMGQKFVARDLDNFPFRYEWDEVKRVWVLQHYLRWKNL